MRALFLTLLCFSTATHAATPQEVCDKQHVACFHKCWKKTPPYPYEKGKQGHYEYCRTVCLKQYMECLESAKLKAREFSTQSEALEWLRKHKKEVAVGAIILVAGTVFIVATGGGGALVLAPLL